MRTITTVALFLALAAGLFAATETEAIAKHWQTSAEFTLAVAEAMPAEAYNFAPNPDEMSFGKLLIHYAAYNNMAVGRVTGVKPPALPDKIMAVNKDPKGTIDKQSTVEFLKSSAEFCGQALKQLTPAKLDEMFGPEGRQSTGREALWSAFTHSAHHRGQAEVYLRVKGIVPPKYRF